MSIVNRTTLKTYFNDEDSPSSSNHDNLVESMKGAFLEEYVTVTSLAQSTSDAILVMVAPRNLKITSWFKLTSLADQSYLDCSLMRNRGGVITEIGTDPAISKIVDTASAIGTTSSLISDSKVNTGDAIYVLINGVSFSSGVLKIELRYT